MNESDRKLNYALDLYYELSQPRNPFKKKSAMIAYYEKEADGIFLKKFRDFLSDRTDLEIKWAMEKLANGGEKNQIAGTQSFYDVFIPMLANSLFYYDLEEGIDRGLAGSFNLINFESTGEWVVPTIALLFIYVGFKKKWF